MGQNARIKAATAVRSEITLSGNAINKVQLRGKDALDVKKVSNLMVDVIKRNRRLWRTEINHWQAARYSRYSVDMPRTHQMVEVYEDILLDGHLTGISENRTLRTTNKDYIFAIDGKKDDKLTEFIKDKEWFEKILEWSHKSIYHGYSLIFINEFTKGEIQDVQLVHRGLVIPERNILLYDIDSDKGLDFTELDDILLYAQFNDPVGLLEKAAVYTILKRHSWGSWDEFEELFGIPIRIAKIASTSETVKNEVAGWLEEMGSAPYGVFPIGTEVDIKENAKTDSFNVFFKKIEALDKELSKLVLHQTMTTEDGSSNSQAGVHSETLNEVIFADEKRMLAFLNKRLVNSMRALGYKIPENAKIMVEQTKDPSKQIDIDDKLMSRGIIPTQAYIEEVYGMEIERMPEAGKTIDPAGKD